jgi:hypothetical protein
MLRIVEFFERYSKNDRPTPQGPPGPKVTGESAAPSAQ